MFRCHGYWGTTLGLIVWGSCEKLFPGLVVIEWSHQSWDMTGSVLWSSQEHLFCSKTLQLFPSLLSLGEAERAETSGEDTESHPDDHDVAVLALNLCSMCYSTSHPLPVPISFCWTQGAWCKMWHGCSSGQFIFISAAISGGAGTNRPRILCLLGKNETRAPSRKLCRNHFRKMPNYIIIPSIKLSTPQCPHNNGWHLKTITELKGLQLYFSATSPVRVYTVTPQQPGCAD